MNIFWISLKNSIASIRNRIQDTGLWKIVLNVLLVLSVGLSSWYAMSTFVDTMYLTLAALIAFGLSVVSYVLNFDISLIQHFREKKKIPFIIPSVILLLVFGFSAILTMLINKETNFLVTYGYYVLCLSHCLLKSSILKNCCINF